MVSTGSGRGPLEDLQVASLMVVPPLVARSRHDGRPRWAPTMGAHDGRPGWSPTMGAHDGRLRWATQQTCFVRACAMMVQAALRAAHQGATQQTCFVRACAMRVQAALCAAHRRATRQTCLARVQPRRLARGRSGRRLRRQSASLLRWWQPRKLQHRTGRSPEQLGVRHACWCATWALCCCCSGSRLELGRTEAMTEARKQLRQQLCRCSSRLCRCSW